MNKKGITPLVSAVSLIFFAIALGILVMSWGNSGQSGYESSCINAKVNIIKVNDKPFACNAGNKVYFTIENNGAEKLSGVLVSVVGKDGIAQKELTQPLWIAEIAKMEIENQPGNGEVMQLRIVPLLNTVACTNNMFISENIERCS